MTFQDKEKQKQYNQIYYSKNKEKIFSKISKKEACPFCGREIRHDNMLKHIKSEYCQRRRKLLKQIQEEN